MAVAWQIGLLLLIYLFFSFLDIIIIVVGQPETVPQAIIDMNRVVEVSEAEQVTGHSFSLALTAADRVHFLKGTSREESKWWFDVLSMFPRTNMKVTTKLKFNKIIITNDMSTFD